MSAVIKAADVKPAQAPVHTCHWPGCEKVVAPALWGCQKHWFALPRNLRAAVWATYRHGQEVDKRPSTAYLGAAAAVQRWIREHLKETAP
ncbi:MAG TPA: hypothetical protein VNU71_20875 [Burkholderiaceae bacterium]|nr:hypothetical protein [Burkholderiaceae bacterium]